MFTRFQNRTDAGRQLGELLEHLRGQNVIVLGLPRGGIPVASAIARALDAPMDVLNVRRLGVPWHEQLTMGALAAGGRRVLNNDIIMATGVTQADLDEATAFQRIEVERRERLFRCGRQAPQVRGKVVVLVDDGIVTGASVRAAISVLRAQRPARLVLAVPVVQQSIASELEREIDELVAVRRPLDLYAVGVWYDSFDEVTDRDAKSALSRAKIAGGGWPTYEPHVGGFLVGEDMPVPIS